MSGSAIRPGSGISVQPENPKYNKAIFAGGCFWCMQPPFEKLNGVKEVVAGYTGGNGTNPNYKDYARKGHVEAVEIKYDPSIISYSRLLDVFWRQIDPTEAGGQFVDRGPQYRSAIFYVNEEQKQQAEQSKEALAQSGKYDKPIVTEIINASPFYKAEEYHQDYHKKNPTRYKYYHHGSGRGEYLKQIWGDASDQKVTDADPAFKKLGNAELKEMLMPLQYKVTQEKGTEPAFKNEYWDNHEDGIYVDIISGEVLYSSKDKYESGTGWPSFTKPLDPNNIVEREDTGSFTTTTEVRSKAGDNHLGHVFTDGPEPTGLRYCMNSAALKFIPKAELEKKAMENMQNFLSEQIFIVIRQNATST